MFVDKKLKLGRLIVPIFIIAVVLISLFYSSYFNKNLNQAKAQIPTNGLVAHWKFDEGSGTTALDSSGNGNTGTLINGPLWVTGKVNSALDFDGVNDQVTTNLTTSYTTITIAAWIYIDACPAGARRIVYKGDPFELEWYVDCSTLSLRHGRSFGSYGQWTTPNNSLSLGQWIHVAVTHDVSSSANDPALYLNGGAQTVTRLITPSGTAVQNASTYLIGASTASSFDGKLDEVLLYNRALNASEISQVYNDGLGPPDTTPPTISITSPASGAIVSGTITVSADASDNVGVSGVQFLLNGTNLGTEDTSSPYSISWNTTAATNGSHTLTARARDAAGNQTTSTGITVTVSNVADTTPPSTPTNLTATTVSSSQINLSWTASTDNVGVTGYRVERCQGAGCTSFVQIATPTGTTYSDTGLSANTSYSYRVRATDAAGNLSGYSSTASATTQAAGTGVIHTNPWDSKTGLGWVYTSDPSTPAIDGTTNTPNPVNALRFWYKTGIIAGFGDQGVAELNHADQQELYVGHWFKYSPNFEWQTINNKVDIWHFTGGGNFVVGVWGSNQPAPQTLVLTPQVSWGTGTANFFSNTGYNPVIQPDRWYWLEVRGVCNSPNTSDAIGEIWLDGQLVMRHTNLSFAQAGGNCFDIFQHHPIWGGGGQTKTKDDYLWIDYTVLSTQPIGMPGTPPPSDTTPPSTPTNLSATSVSSSQINLSWTASTDNVGVTGYRVERCQGAGCTSFTQIATPTGTSYSDTGLSANTTYSYRVRATDAAGNLSGYSSTASATTQAAGTGVIHTNPWDTKTGTGWIYSSGRQPEIDAATNTPNPANALRFTFLAGDGDGDGLEGLAEYDLPDQEDLWFGHWFKYSSNFEWHPVGNKLSYIVFAAGGQGRLFVGVWGSQQGTDSLKIVLETASLTWGTPSVNYFSNTGYNPTIQKDQWYWLEVHLKMNTPGVADGIAEAWLDGQLLMRHNNMPYRSSTQTGLGFGILKHSPIWGGNVGVVKPQTDYLWMDYTVLSTQPIGMPSQPDTTPPILSSGAPTGRLAADTTQTTLSLNTNENSTCRYSSSAGVSYSSMTGSFSSTGGLSHSTTVTGLTNGSVNKYYIRCQDSAGNANTTDYSVIFSIALPPTILFQEPFEDSNFSSRGWYDTPDFELTTLEAAPGSTRSTEFSFAQGNTVPRNASGLQENGRVIFPASEVVYLRYYVKYSSNWQGSNRLYHPHEFHFLTDLDGAFIGPSDTHLTAYIEQNEGTPLLALQDNLNIDTNCILLTNGSFVGCGGSFTTYPFTENRSAVYCNGIAGGFYKGGCFAFPTQSGYYGERRWDAPAIYFSDNSGPYYKNDWHLVEAMFSLNSIVEGKGVPDGQIRYWFDGNLVISYDNILLRTASHPDMKFNQLIIAPYIGDGSPVDQKFWVDNLTVANYQISPVADTASPSIPTNLTATTVSSSQINLSWTASTDNVGVTGYRVYRAGVQIATATTTSYSDTSLSPSTTYTYTVAAVDAAGNVSVQSSPASATTLAAPDTTPPTVSISSPTSGSTVSGIITVSATASDNVGIAGVQFRLDGINLGLEDSSSPYSISWNTTLTLNGSHTLTAVARDTSGNITTSSAITVTVNNDLTPPVISNVSAINITTSSAAIIWTTNEPSTSQVEYGFTTSYGNITPLDSNLVTAHSINLTGLSDGSTYNYRVRSTDAAGNTAQSINFTFNTPSVIPPDTTPPEQITNLSVTNTTNNTVSLSWTAPGDDGNIGTALSYQMRWLTVPITDSNWNVAISVTGLPNPLPAGSNQTFTVINLSPATRYYFAIKTLDEVGNISLLSNVADGRTKRNPPGGVRNLSAQTSDITTNARWDPPLNADSDIRYVVLRNTTSGLSVYDIQNVIVVQDNTLTSFVDSNLVINTTYYYSVFAYYDLGLYSEGIFVSVRPAIAPTTSSGGGGGGLYIPDTTPPGSVFDAKIQSGDSQNLLSWSNPADQDFYENIIYRLQGTPFDSALFSQCDVISDKKCAGGDRVFRGNAQEFVDVKLENNKTYYYVIFSLDTANNRSIPKLFSAIPQAGIISLVDPKQLIRPFPFKESALIRFEDKPEVYFIEQNRLRHIPSLEIFESHKFSFANVRVLLKDQYDIRDFEKQISSPLEKASVIIKPPSVKPPKALPYPEGSLIKVTTRPEVYLLKDRSLHHILSFGVFIAHGFAFDKVRSINETAFNSLKELAPIGSPLAYSPNTLIRAQNQPTIYLVKDNQKQPIPTLRVFYSHGFLFDNVVVLPKKEVNEIPTLDIPLAQNVFSDNTLIRPVTSPRVYIIKDGKSFWIPTLQKFNEKGLKFEDVKIIHPEALKEYPFGGVVQ